MSKKSQIKKQIAESEKEIEALEKKRLRSHSLLTEASVTGVKPDPSDVKYFHIYTELIELERKNMRQLNAELERLTKKK